MELKDVDLEKKLTTPRQKPRATITYADAFDDDDAAGPPMDRNRYPSMGRAFSRERRGSVSTVRTARTTRSMDLSRTISRRRSLDPETTLPIGFRTLSIHVEGTKEKAPLPVGKGKGHSRSQVVELTSLDWHKISVEEVTKRLATSSTTGITSITAKDRLARDGPNKLTPVSTKLAQRIFWYIFVSSLGLVSFPPAKLWSGRLR